MKLFGSRLSSTSSMIPSAGIFGALLPILGLVALAVCAADFGAPGIEKAIVAVGAFAGGVLMSRSLPVWRRARQGELRRLDKARESSPFNPWLRVASRVGWLKAVALFLCVCGALALLASILR